MPDLPDQRALTLRSAIAWTLYLADAQHDTLIVALLTQALALADDEQRPPSLACRNDPAQRPSISLAKSVRLCGACP